MFLSKNDKQFGLWVMRRCGTADITIANRCGISRQAVSRALLTMDEKIGAALRKMARANQIATEKIDLERGVLLGRSLPFQTAAMIFISEKHGRSGTSMTGTAAPASGTPNASNSSGTMQLSWV